MKVYKFGGASVKDAEAVRNVAQIIQDRSPEDLWVVVSAMAKTTNALEKTLHAYRTGSPDAAEQLETIYQFHMSIISDLFPFSEHSVWNDVSTDFASLKSHLEEMGSRHEDSDYAHVVGVGEIASTRILSAYLESVGTINTWCDARALIHTDSRFLEAKVDLAKSQSAIVKQDKTIEDQSTLLGDSGRVVITQGFIGSSGEQTTTLGREGSDYTGGILAWSLDADELSIWKDVPGMLNADPKYFPGAEIIEQLSYREAIELSYYGASVIHPKTIKPLQNKGIPLFVRSFVQPDTPGTIIHVDEARDQDRPSYIFKQDQLLLSIIPLDFSFIMEENISEIFSLLAKHGLKANLIQNSAVSFSICMDNKRDAIGRLRDELSEHFKVLYNDELSLITIRHYDEQIIDRLLKDRTIMVEQRSRQTARYVIKGGFNLSN